MRVKEYFIIVIAFFLFSTNTLSQNSVQFTVYFDVDSSNVSIVEQTKFKAFCRSLDTIIVNQISIKAFCDDVGSNSYNFTLSVERAEHIKSLVINNCDVNLDLVVSQGMGSIESVNISEKSLSSFRKSSRRADIVVSYSEKSNNRITQLNEEQPDYQFEKVNYFDDSQVGDIIELENILFVGGRQVLLKQSYPALDNLVWMMKENENYHILILGHVCCVEKGKDGLNYDTGKNNLSLARAKVIYDYLIINGIKKSRLKYKGLKGEKPTGLGPKFDRRVEIQLIKK